jgi:hypothetical protein
METMKSLAPQLTLVDTSSTQSAGFVAMCADLPLKALKTLARAYLESAQYNLYWIGSPAGFPRQARP